MRNHYIFFLRILFAGLCLSSLLFINACRSSKSLDNQNSSFEAFSKQFPQLILPYNYTDDSLLTSPPDSLKIINPRQFKFLPDSILYPKGDTSVAVYALGQGASEEGQNQWYFLKTERSGAKEVYALIYNNKDSLIEIKKVAGQTTAKNKTIRTFKWTKAHLLIVHEKTALGNGYVYRKKEVYTLDETNHLQLILTNNERPSEEEQL